MLVLNVRDLVTRIIAHIDRYLKHDVNRHGRFVRLSLDSAEETYVDDVMLPALRADGKPWARDIIDKLPSVI